MASFVYGNSNGALNGTSQVDVVAAPAALTQRGVRNVKFYNRDTVAHLITVKLSDNGTLRFLDAQTVQPGQAWFFGAFTVLDSSLKKLVAVMGEAVTTTNPDFDAAWSDNT